MSFCRVQDTSTIVSKHNSKHDCCTWTFYRISSESFYPKKEEQEKKMNSLFHCKN